MQNKVIDAFRDGNLLKLLRGEVPYSYMTYSNANNVVPTNVEEVVSDIFSVYEVNPHIYNDFRETLLTMTGLSAEDYYLVWQYLEYILYRESKNTAPFSIVDNELVSRMQVGARKFYSQLQVRVVFKNGVEKLEPWKNIERGNLYLKNRCNISILE